MNIILGTLKELAAEDRRPVIVRRLVSSIIYLSVPLFIIVLFYIELGDCGILTNINRIVYPQSSKGNVTHRSGTHIHHQSSSSQASKSGASRGRQARSIYFAVNDSNLSANNNNNNNHVQEMRISSKPFNYQNDQPQILTQCCACDEAKYELVFEGLWSRFTHPDDFPDNYWSAYFSDIIGASHSTEFKMWNLDSFATEGVKELAESGSTKKLESELKQVSSKTRTIIKARELRYPTLNSKTSAVFRTDRQHHLVSILSKLGPSPDWMVGVSGLELCQNDCSWATQRIVNLYLWDAGTDSGTTFTSPDIPTRPQEKIHPFRKSSSSSSSNSNYTQRGSFSSSYDPTGFNPIDTYLNNNNNQRKSYDQTYTNGGDVFSSTGPNDTTYTGASSSSSGTSSSYGGGGVSVANADQSKPFARLTVTRQRIYEKSCNGESIMQSYKPPPYSPPSERIPPWIDSKIQNVDCRFTGWSDWSSCSSTCGRGIRTRTRAFVDEQAHLSGCSQVDLIEKEVCLSECIGNTTCVTRDWSEWSQCSVSCGNGYRKRTRSPIGPMTRQCESIEYAQHEPCSVGSANDCPPESTQCEVTDWSQWSDCSVACGKGTRIRTRQYLRKDNIENCSAKLIQKQSCFRRQEQCKPTSTEICTKPQFPGQCQAAIPRWYYNKLRGMCEMFVFGGCLGPFEKTPPEQINPNLPVIDCKLSAWSPWSTCSALCGHGKRTRSRYIIQMPQNGGKPCDKKLSRTQRCKDLPPCPPNYEKGVSSQSQNTKITNNNSNHHQHHHKGGNGNKHQGGSRNHDWKLTTSTTTGSSMMDDEDDSKFSRLLQAESGLLQPTSFTSNVSAIGQDGTVANSTELIDEDEPKDHEKPCEYGNWTQWSDCEVVCQPVKKGSNKVRQRIPINNDLDEKCLILEELYYCDPNIYC